MSRNQTPTENQLDDWVRGNNREAQEVIVELISKLVATSSPSPKARRFPLGDSIGQHGPDGFLDAAAGLDPFVPLGMSHWEIGVSINARAKATSDYKSLTDSIPSEERKESEFIFVTPLSGRRDWPYTWKKDSQKNWLKTRKKQGKWKNIRIIDGSVLIDWLQQYPSVAIWLSRKMGLPTHELQTPEQRWNELKMIGAPPILTPHIFLINRETACAKMKEIFAGDSIQLKIDTHFPDHMADFVAAYLETANETEKPEFTGRCLIVSGREGWDAIVSLKERQTLVANFDIEKDPAGVKLLQRARNGGHAVIYAGTPGGIPHPNRTSLPDPKSYQILDALIKMGYNEHRARTFSERCNGSISTLLSYLQSISSIPEWAQSNYAADLAIAQLLGGWDENSKADRLIVETLSGKSFGGWIEIMRAVALLPNTPLVLRDGCGRISKRYEVWHLLGERIFNEHLDRFKDVAIRVLSERDPKFELPLDKHYAANIYGKIPNYSHTMRKGLSESLALLGAYPKALSSCSIGKTETITKTIVHEILSQTDWVLWASLSEFLPALAEAAPDFFLGAVEDAVDINPSCFDQILSQEVSGIINYNYMSGILWSLEALAWDPAYLSQIILILGKLALKDPGGQAAGRPINSLRTILLPWQPQTCASAENQVSVVTMLCKKIPSIGWKLLLFILPSSSQISSGSYKPRWRSTIPDDWSDGVTVEIYSKQIKCYTELAINESKQDLNKLTQLIDRFEYFPPIAFDQFLAHLESKDILWMSQEDRYQLWNSLSYLIGKHKKYSTADWAFKPEKLNRISIVTKKLAPDPIYQHRRLFDNRDWDLCEEQGNFDDRNKELERRREQAIAILFTDGDIEAVLKFSQLVESPFQVGIAFSKSTSIDIDKAILPIHLGKNPTPFSEFTEGFIKGRFNGKGWEWVDQIDVSLWTAEEKVHLLKLLPFDTQTWEKSLQILKENEPMYWRQVNPDPYRTKGSLDIPIDRFLQYGRPIEAIRCLEKSLYQKKELDIPRAIQVLQAILGSSQMISNIQVHSIVEIIKILQKSPNANSEDLFQIECGFLSLLDHPESVQPKSIERRLAQDPDFFCEVIRLVFCPANKEPPIQEKLTDVQKAVSTRAYTLLQNWKTPPGRLEDGTFDQTALTSWLNSVRNACEKSGHLEIALCKLGHALVYVPSDPEGLWLPHSVAEVLNASNAKDMRDGFITELFNSRGVHPWTAGKDELDLSKYYLKQSQELEEHGYFRLAASLKELSTSYKIDSDDQSSKDPFE